MESATWLKHAAYGAALLTLLFASSASATPVPLDHGSIPYVGTVNSSGNSLQGSIEYWVFSPNTFPYSGYSPSTSDYVYMYQLHESNAANASPISSLSIGFSATTVTNQGQTADPALGAGLTASDLGTVGQQSAILTDPSDTAPSSVYWFFHSIIQPGGNSYGLVFESPYSPALGSFALSDHGSSAGTSADPATLIPVPGNTNVPEPSTIMLGLLAAAGMIPVARRRMRVR
ncbi:MAG TPA: PEP-CTERM sorting domain-containing protein [Pirellulales bacterium]|jgi:hypothetical protein